MVILIEYGNHVAKKPGKCTKLQKRRQYKIEEKISIIKSQASQLHARQISNIEISIKRIYTVI